MVTLAISFALPVTALPPAGPTRYLQGPPSALEGSPLFSDRGLFR